MSMEDDEFEIEIKTDEDDEEIVSKKLMHPLHLQRRIAILVVIEDFRYNGADDKFLSDAADLYMSDLAKDEVELLKKESEAPGMRNYVDALVSPDSKLWPYRNRSYHWSSLVLSFRSIVIREIITVQ